LPDKTAPRNIPPIAVPPKITTIVTPIQTLLVELTSIGNVAYYGNPVLTVSVHTGSGKIIKK